MPNPDGVNGFGGFTKEAPYGSEREMGALTSAEPLPRAPGVTAPRRAQRKATRPQRTAAAPAAAALPQMQAPPEGPPLAYPLLVSAIWREVAADPGASPLVQHLAMLAQSQAVPNA